MKKLCVGVLLAFGLLSAQTVSATPCTLCTIYNPCDTICEHCYPGLEGPGYWIDGGYCWGEMVVGSCGDYGPCSGQPASSWSCESVVDQGVNPEPGAQSLPDLILTAPPAH